MSVYKSAGLFLILISASFSSFSSYLNPPPLPVCKEIFRFTPSYPPRALALRIEGRVKFSYDIDAFGKVVNVHILKAQPANMFERSLIDALSMWRYDCYGVPLKGLVTTVTFRLSPAR
ncbi:TonB family protein [Salmonella enterica subsp. enterica serovar Newport]|nr:TonB family protein [Salmonella enterica subsp. enterica serovar Newport]